jgi:hypothetical protein
LKEPQVKQCVPTVSAFNVTQVCGNRCSDFWLRY